MKESMENERTLMEISAETFEDEAAKEEVVKTKKYDKASADHARCIKLIFDLCNALGYHIEGRIVLRDRKTGRLWE